MALLMMVTLTACGHTGSTTAGPSQTQGTESSFPTSTGFLSFSDLQNTQYWHFTQVHPFFFYPKE